MVTGPPEAIAKGELERIFGSKIKPPQIPKRSFKPVIDGLLAQPGKRVTSVPDTPPVAKNFGNGGKSRLPNFTKEFEVNSKTWIVLKILGLIVLLILVLVGVNELDDYYEAKRNKRENNKAAAELELEKKKLEIEQVKRQMAPVPGVQAKAVQIGFDCSSETSKANRYKDDSGASGVHNISSVKSVTGCMWAVPDTRVSFVQGKDYEIEVLDPKNPAMSYKCPNARAPTCASFINEIKDSPNFVDKKFRILVRQGGYVNIS